MGHELRPRTGHLPSAKEVARLLAIEFAFVRTDEAEGLERARKLAAWIEQARASIFLGRHDEALAGAKRLRGLASGDALTIEFGDSRSRTTSIAVIPGEPIKFGYASNDEEAASRDLVERCARALDCEVVLF
jgi:hypothetical protein